MCEGEPPEKIARPGEAPIRGLKGTTKERRNYIRVFVFLLLCLPLRIVRVQLVSGTWDSLR